MRSEASIKLSRCVSTILLFVRLAQEIISKICLACVTSITIRRRGNLNAKKIAEGAKTFHLKVLIEELLKFLNTNGIISSDDHIINI